MASASAQPSAEFQQLMQAASQALNGAVAPNASAAPPPVNVAALPPQTPGMLSPAALLAATLASPGMQAVVAKGAKKGFGGFIKCHWGKLLIGIVVLGGRDILACALLAPQEKGGSSQKCTQA